MPNQRILPFFLCGLLFLGYSGILSAQKLYKVKGQIIDDNSGESLILANISINDGEGGMSSDENGEFSVKLPKGKHKIQTSYVGYRNFSIEFNLTRDTIIRINLKRIDKTLKEVEVVEFQENNADPVRSAQSSAVYLDQKDIEMVPTVAGENDIIKVVQLLPGVNKGIEGTGDFFVRGGDADQNLLLLDGATIYNTGHLFGFVSVFNPDIIGNATVLKGAFPSYYGGRLSSILDVRTQSTISDSTVGEGSIGLISSKLMVKTPIVKNKVGIMISGRRTYIDQVVRTLTNEFQLPYYFYDLNGRIDFQINERHSLYFSSYFGADVLKFEQEAENRDDGSVFRSNNNIYNHSQSLGWSYRTSATSKLDVEMHHAVFKYDILNSFVTEKIEANSGIEDYGISINFQNSLNEKTTLYLGANAINHQVSPIEFTTTGVLNSILPSSRSEGSNITEGSVYGEVAYDVNERLRARVGYRQSYGIYKNKIYPGFEPRLAVRYLLNESSSFKLSYSRMSQFLHRVSSSSLTLPVDFWYTITDNIRPQSADQYTIGYAWRSPNRLYVVESDIYYKDMRNLTEYEAGTTLLFNADFEDALLQGTGESYGFELLVRKEGEKFYGWLSYSLGWAFRQFDALNEGRPFNSTYDRRHNGAIVLQYNFYRRWAVSGVWEYISGSRFTPVIGQYAVTNPVNTGIDVVNIYSDRNAYILSNSHRLDLMIILKSKEKRRVQGEWRAGVYNVYNRATPVQMYVGIDESGNYQYIQPGLFGALPFVSYHFRF